VSFIDNNDELFDKVFNDNVRNGERKKEAYSLTGFNVSESIFLKEELRLNDTIIPEGNEAFFDIDYKDMSVIIAIEMEDWNYIICDVSFLKRYFDQ